MSSTKKTQKEIIEALSSALILCLQCKGLDGYVYDLEKQTLMSIRGKVCDALEAAGYEVDREAAHALALSKRDYAKWKKEREAAQKS